MSDIDTLIADLRANKQSDLAQPTIAKIDDWIAALQEIQGVVDNFTFNGTVIATNFTAQTPVTGVAATGISTYGNNSFTNTRYVNSSAAPSNTVQHARGDSTTPLVILQNDLLGTMQFNGYSGSGFVVASRYRVDVVAATPSATDMESRLRWDFCPAGSVSLTEVLRLSHAGGQQMYGANTVIDSSRVFRNRVFTVATLPAANIAAGQVAQVSDATATLTAGIGAVVVGGGANNVPVNSDGAAWRIG